MWSPFAPPLHPWETFSLCSPDWPQAHHPPASASWLLELRVYNTTPRQRLFAHAHTCPSRHLTNVLWPVTGCHTKGSSHCPRVKSPQQCRTDQLAWQVKRPQPKSWIFLESLGSWVQSYCPSIAFCSAKEEHVWHRHSPFCVILCWLTEPLPLPFCDTAQGIWSENNI